MKLLLFVLFCLGVAAFNPQPDPPGRSATIPSEDVAFNPQPDPPGDLRRLPIGYTP